MIECERCWTYLQKMQHKTTTNILWYGECLCFILYKHLYSWERITQILYIPSEIQENDLTMKQMFDISEKLTVGQSDEIDGLNTINSGDSSWKHLSLFGNEEVVSLLHTNIYVLSDSVVPWKDEREHRIKYFLGRQVDVVQQFTTIHSFGQSWWANGIRVEYFLSIHHIAALSQSSRVLVKNEQKPWRIYRTDHLHVDVQRHLMGSQDNEQECKLSANLVFYFEARRFPPGSWIRKGVAFYSWQQPQGECDRVEELMMVTQADTQSSDPRVQSPKECWRAKVEENYQYTAALVRKRLKLFFRTITSVNQLSIYRGVSDLCEECKACHVWMAIYVMVGQSDPLFVPTSSLMKTPYTSDRWSCARRFYCKSTKNEWKGWLIFVFMCIPDNCWRRTAHYDKRHWKTLAIYRISGLSGFHFAKRWKNHLTRKVGFKGTPKFGPYWKSQPVTYKVNMKTPVSRGSEFLIVWIGWSRTWATIRRTTTMST